MNHLTNKIEAILFVSTKPLSAKQLAKLCGKPEAEVNQALKELSEQRKESGVVLLEANGNFQLATNAEYSKDVQEFLTADLKEALTEATSEVLAIIAYRQPISKAEIEAIRGVNSQYSLRNLLMRGLIEKTRNPKDARGPAYQVTTDFMQQLGITDIKELPLFDDVTSKVKLPETPSLSENSTPSDSEE